MVANHLLVLNISFNSNKKKNTVKYLPKISHSQTSLQNPRKIFTNLITVCPAAQSLLADGFYRHLTPSPLIFASLSPLSVASLSPLLPLNIANHRCLIPSPITVDFTIASQPPIACSISSSSSWFCK